MRKYQVSIDRAPMGLNRYIRIHWAQRVRERERWVEEIWAAFDGRPPRLGTAKVQIYVETSHPQDPDNLQGSCKPILDAMRRLGIIDDDDESSIKLDVKQKRAKKGKTTIVLSPLT